MTKPLLLVGEIRGLGVEAMEISRELGFDPHSVVTEVVDDNSLCPQILAASLTEAQRQWPAVIVGVRRYPDLQHQRLDRRWCEATQRLREEMENLGVSNWICLIHPSALISPTARLGRGVVVGPGANISSYTQVGDFVSVGRSSSISHHCRIGDYSRLGPGVIIPGQVTIGSKVVIGPSATFVNGIVVTDGVLIGAGSVVTRHITKPLQVMGNPARVPRRPLSLVRRALKRAARRVFTGTRYFSLLQRRYQTGRW